MTKHQKDLWEDETGQSKEIPHGEDTPSCFLPFSLSLHNALVAANGRLVPGDPLRLWVTP